MATSNRAEPAFLLHSTPYRETSLLVDLFIREQGRIAAIAKGAKRPASALRGVLHQFQPLLVSYTGRQELRTLTAAQWVGGLALPMGDALLCAFYLNELLIRLLPREDPHPVLFDGYAAALGELASASDREPDSGSQRELALRRFEWLLLRETGYAPDLEQDTAGRAVAQATGYRWQPGGGFIAIAAAGGAQGVHEPAAPETPAGYEAPLSPRTIDGSTLLDIAAGRFDAPASRQQAKYLTRAILSHRLEGQTLHTRQILIDLQRL